MCLAEGQFLVHHKSLVGVEIVCLISSPLKDTFWKGVDVDMEVLLRLR